MLNLRAQLQNFTINLPFGFILASYWRFFKKLSYKEFSYFKFIRYFYLRVCGKVPFIERRSYRSSNQANSSSSLSTCWWTTLLSFWTKAWNHYGEFTRYRKQWRTNLRGINNQMSKKAAHMGQWKATVGMPPQVSTTSWLWNGLKVFFLGFSKVPNAIFSLISTNDSLSISREQSVFFQPRPLPYHVPVLELSSNIVVV